MRLATQFAAWPINSPITVHPPLALGRVVRDAGHRHRVREGFLDIRHQYAHLARIRPDRVLEERRDIARRPVPRLQMLAAWDLTALPTCGKPAKCARYVISRRTRLQMYGSLSALQQERFSGGRGASEELALSTIVKKDRLPLGEGLDHEALTREDILRMVRGAYILICCHAESAVSSLHAALFINLETYLSSRPGPGTATGTYRGRIYPQRP